MIAGACSMLESGASPKVYDHGKLIAEDLYRSFRCPGFWSLLRRASWWPGLPS